MKFKVGQKVVRVSNDFVFNNILPKMEIGEVVTVKGDAGKNHIFIEEYPLCEDLTLAAFDERHFAPIIEAEHFIEMTFRKILDTTPKICAQ